MTEPQPYLGDVIGELPPMRMPYRRRYQPADWIVNIKHVVAAAAGVTFWAVLLIAMLLSAFLAAKPALAAEAKCFSSPRASVAATRAAQRILDQEFFDQVDSFVDDLMVSMPASVEGAINALDVKIQRLRQKRK